MRLMTCIVLFVNLGTLLSGSAALRPERDAADNAVPAGAQVLPVVQVDTQLSSEVALAFHNDTDEPIRYLVAPDLQGMAFLTVVLTRDGELIKPVAWNGTPLDPRHVRELAPGEELIFPARLRQRYLKLEPGRYLLEVRMEGQPPDFGLSPIHLHQRVLHLRVEED
jgi:hypothetical protein